LVLLIALQGVASGLENGEDLAPVGIRGEEVRR
jgi:hypothetical protein